MKYIRKPAFEGCRKTDISRSINIELNGMYPINMQIPTIQYHSTPDTQCRYTPIVETKAIKNPADMIQ